MTIFHVHIAINYIYMCALYPPCWLNYCIHSSMVLLRYTLLKWDVYDVMPNNKIECTVNDVNINGIVGW